VLGAGLDVPAVGVVVAAGNPMDGVGGATNSLVEEGVRGVLHTI
jgi:hypothetical protein